MKSLQQRDDDFLQAGSSGGEQRKQFTSEGDCDGDQHVVQG